MKSLLVGARSMSTKRVAARNLDMILASIVRSRRASMIVPFIEQCMVMEGERIRISLEECFTSIDHSFGGSFLGERSHEDLKDKMENVSQPSCARSSLKCSLNHQI